MANPPVPSPYLEPAAIQVIRGRYGGRDPETVTGLSFRRSAIADNETTSGAELWLVHPTGWGRNMTVNIRSADPGVKMQDSTSSMRLYGLYATHNDIFTHPAPPVQPFAQGLGQVGYETADRVSDQEIKIEDVVTQPGVVDMFTRTISSSPLIVRSSGPRNISAMRLEFEYDVEDMRALEGLGVLITIAINGQDVLELNAEQLGLNEALAEIDEAMLPLDGFFGSVDMLNGFLRQDVPLFQCDGPGVPMGMVLHYSSHNSRYYKWTAREKQDEKTYWSPFGQGWGWNFGARILGKAAETTDRETGDKEFSYRLVQDPLGRVSAFQRIGTSNEFRPITKGWWRRWFGLSDAVMRLYDTGSGFVLKSGDHSEQWSFDADGRLTEIRNRQYGRALALAYQGGGIQITDSSGRLTQLTLAGDLVTQMTDPAGAIWNFIYDGPNLVEIRSQEGTIATFGYHQDDYVMTASSNAMGADTSYLYQAGDKTNERIRRGSIKEAVTTGPDIPTARHQFAYQNGGDPDDSFVLTHTGARGAVTRYTVSVDQGGEARIDIAAPGNANGRMTFTTDWLMTKLRDAMGQETVYDMDLALGIPRNINFPGGLRQRYRGRGPGPRRIERITDTAGIRTQFEYVSLGGAQDLMSKATYATSFGGQPNFIAEYDYAGPGDMIEERESNGEITSFQYAQTPGILGLPVKMVRCIGHSEVQEKDLDYSPYGWLTRMAGADYEYRWTKNSRGHETEAIEKVAGKEAWSRKQVNAHGCIEREEHSSGDLEVNVFNANGQPKEETVTGADGVSHTVRYDYDANNNVIKVSSPAGETILDYTARDELEKIELPDGTKTEYKYNARGDVIEETRIDAQGNRHVTGNEVDAYGRVTKITQPEVPLPDGSGNLWRPSLEFSYFPNGEAQTIRQELVPGVFSQKTYRLDGMGRPYLCEMEVPNEGTYEQIQALDLTGRIDMSRGPIFRFTGSTSARPIVIEGEDRQGQYLRLFSHDCRDRITAIRGRNQRLFAEYEYDNDDNLTKIHQPDPRTTTGNSRILAQDRQMGPDGRLSEIREPGGHVTGFAFDDANGAIEVTESGGGTIRSESGENGLIHHQTRSASGLTGVESFFTYNEFDEVTAIEHRNALPGGQVERQPYQFTYDQFGKLATKTDPIGRIVTTGYDSQGRLSSADNGGQAIRYEYDALDRMIRKRFPGAHGDCKYAYDGHGNMTYAENDVSTCRWEYDTLGRIKERSVTFKGPNVTKTIRYQYDKYGMLANKQDSDGGKIRYRYTRDEQLRELFLDNETDPVVRRSYKSWGGLHQQILVRGGLNSLYDYDTAGKISSIKHTIFSRDYARFDYLRASDRRVTEMRRTGALEQTMTCQYDGFGRLKGQTSYSPEEKGNLEEIYAYDAMGNLRDFQTDGSAGTAEFDLANQIERITIPQVTAVDPGLLSVSASSVEQGYQADHVLDGRIVQPLNMANAWRSEANGDDHVLTLETQSALTVNVAEIWLPVEFGPASGLLVDIRRQGQTNWEPLAISGVLGGNFQNNRLDVSGPRARMFFAPVQITGLRVTAPSGSGFDQAPDPADRLSFAILEMRLMLAGGSSLSFDHDEFGSLTRRGSFDFTHDAESRLTRIQGPGVDLEQQYGPDGRLAVSVDHSSGQITLHLYDGPNLHGEYRANGDPIRRYLNIPLEFAPLGFVEGGGQLSQAPLHFYLLDERNSVTHLVRDTNLLENSYLYDAWGNLLEETETVPQPLRFMGGRWISGAEILHLGQRYYDPLTHRFLEQDRVPKGPNHYPAFRNDPVNLSDPLGTSIGDFFESVVETAKEFPGVLYEDFASGAAAQRLRSFGKGFVEGTVAAVEGTVHAITHPIETVEGTINAIVNYDKVIEGLEQQWDKLLWQAANDPQAFAESVGRFIGELEAGMVMGAGMDKLKSVAKIGDMASDLQRRVRHLRNSTNQTRMHLTKKHDKAPQLQPDTGTASPMGAAKGPKSQKKRRRRSRAVPPEQKIPPNLKLPRGSFRSSIRKKYKVKQGLEDRRHYLSDHSVRRILSEIANHTDNPIKMFREMNRNLGFKELPRNVTVYSAARKLQQNIFNDPKNFFVGPAAPNQVLGRQLAAEIRAGRGVNLMGGPTWDNAAARMSNLAT